MADNITSPIPSGTVLATKDLGGVHLPKNTIVDQAGNDVVGLVASDPAANTILGRLKAIFDRLGSAIAVTVASLPLPTGAATSAKQDDILTALGGPFAVTGTFWQATQPVSGTVGITGPVAVTGTFWQATQPISAVALPLPAGAAAETTLAGMSGKLPASLGAKAANASFSITPASDATFAVTATALPLPTGAATAAKQDDAKAAIEALAPQGAAFAITKHATNPLEREIGGVAIVTGGTIVYRYPGEGSDRTITLPAGFFPLRATHIRDTSTADGLTGF